MIPTVCLCQLLSQDSLFPLLLFVIAIPTHFQLLVIVFALLTWCFCCWFSSSLSSHCYCASFFFLLPCNYHISSIRRHGYFFSAACFLQLLFEGGYYSRVGFISLENQRWLDKARMSSAVTIIRCCQ